MLFVEQFISICYLWPELKWCFKPYDLFELCPRFLEVKRNVALPEDVWLVDLDEAKIFPPETCVEVRNQYSEDLICLARGCFLSNKLDSHSISASFRFAQLIDADQQVGTLAVQGDNSGC